MTGTIDTIIISLVVTGSVKLAATIGLTEVVTKSLLYYLHERAWLRIPYGRSAKAKGDAMTLPDAESQHS